jgi:hypothetical protein
MVGRIGMFFCELERSVEAEDLGYESFEGSVFEINTP